MLPKMRYQKTIKVSTRPSTNEAVLHGLPQERGEEGRLGKPDGLVGDRRHDHPQAPGQRHGRSENRVLAVGHAVHLGPIGLFAKLGALDWDIEGQTTGSIERDFDESGTDLGYGVGLKFMLWSLEFRAEYEVYDIDDTDNVEMFSFAAAWVF
jgi:hypothetical protein